MTQDSTAPMPKKNHPKNDCHSSHPSHLSQDVECRPVVTNDVHHMFMSLNQPAMIMDMCGNIQAYNHAFATLYRIALSELLEKNLFEAFNSKQLESPFSSVEAALLERTSQTSIKLRKGKASDSSNLPQEFDSRRAVTKNDQYDLTQTVRWSASEIRAGFGKKSILMIGTEISDLIQASNREHFLKSSIIDHIPNHYIFWKDTNSIYLGCNTAFASAMGLKSEMDIIGKTDYDLPTPREQSDAYRKDDQLVMSSGQPKLNIEEYQTLSDGVERVLSTNKTPLFDEEGKVYGILAIYSDITERKKLERSLEAAKNQAEAANQAKTEFIANMSHDIRTPLSGIIGVSEILQEMTEHPEHKKYARWIHDSGKELLSLFNDILDIIKADRINELDLNIETFDLRECLKSIVHLEMPSIQFRNIDIKLNIDETIPQYVMSDRTKLHRVLLNLLGNAIKFTNQGQISIQVSRHGATDEEIQLQFKIIDTGIGIPRELQSQVFERFFRANPSYENEYSGHGVGLHIAQAYVKLLGGEIQLISEPNIGTTFYFELSFQKALEPSGQDQASQESQCNTLSSVDLPSTATPPRILLIEDNYVALKMVENLMTKAGCLYTSAMSAEQALEVLESKTFDLIITDIGLPGLSGFELTKHIREQEQIMGIEPVPIIGLTAHGQEKSLEKSRQSGMNKIYCKPMSASTLQSIVMQFIHSKHCPPQSLTSTQLKSLGPDLPQTEKQLFALKQFPLFDIDEAMIYIGHESTLKEILELLVSKELNLDLDSIKQAYVDNNWQEIQTIAHRIKGGAVYCGTVRMKYACQYLERYYKAGHDKLLVPLYHQLISVIQETQQSIQHWLSCQNSNQALST